MKKLISAAIITATAGLTASPAMAGGAVFYTGLNAGWSVNELEMTSSTKVDDNTFTSEQTWSASGPAFGGILGVKFPISTGYIGLEANVADSSAEYEAIDTVNDQQTLDQTVSSDLGYGLSTILAFNVNAHSQIYGVAGYQMTDIEMTSSTRDLTDGKVTNDTFEETLGGYRLGLGFETMLSSALSARLEWTHTVYSGEEFPLTTADGTFDMELENTESRITLGIMGHF